MKPSRFAPLATDGLPRTVVGVLGHLGPYLTVFSSARPSTNGASNHSQASAAIGRCCKRGRRVERGITAIKRQSPGLIGLLPATSPLFFRFTMPRSGSTTDMATNSTATRTVRQSSHPLIRAPGCPSGHSWVGERRTDNNDRSEGQSTFVSSVKSVHKSANDATANDHSGRHTDATRSRVQGAPVSNCKTGSGDTGLSQIDGKSGGSRSCRSGPLKSPRESGGSAPPTELPQSNWVYRATVMTETAGWPELLYPRL